MRIRFSLFFALCFLMGARGAELPRFFPDDPLLEDNDRIDVPEQPAEIELSDLYDRFSHIFADLGSEERGEAVNVNTLDEVPNSSWFTNRHGQRRMSVEELVRGPDRGEGPDRNAPWMVFAGKTQGITPGFQVMDGRGDRYVIKFDPIEYPELTSSSEIIATKLFYAFGYHVPENYIVNVRPDRFAVKPGTMIEDRFGDTQPLTEDYLRRVLRRVPRLPDGRIRVVASKYVPGRPLGPFRYHGTRSDDPNDIFPHENRRELRGLRLFAAWLNHDDTRAINTLDTFVEEDGRRYIRHYLIDFGSCFGSGSVEPQLPHLGFHYWLDLGLVRQNAAGLGFHVPEYRRVDYPSFPRFKSVGRWESSFYDPEHWKNDYPNPAFVRMTARDAFWAAKILMRFTPEELRAIVQTGELSDPEAEDYFYQTLLERQRKTGRFGLGALNPVDEFRLSGGAIEFTNLYEKYGFAEPGTAYRLRWSLYVNETGATEPIKGPFTQVGTSVPLPLGSYRLPNPERFLLLEVFSLREGHPRWNQRVGVYLRPSETGYEIVGIERASE